MSNIRRVCEHCHYSGDSKRHTKGSFGAELGLWVVFLLISIAAGLWLLLLIPIIYTVWRAVSGYEACPKCHTPNMIPADTPKGQALIKGLEQTDN